MKIINQKDKEEFSKGYKMGYAIAMERSKPNSKPTFIDFRNDDSFKGRGARAGYRAANKQLNDRGLGSRRFGSQNSYVEEISMEELDALLNSL